MGDYKINFNTIYQDALQRLGGFEDELFWESWGEVWPTTALGFGGICGRAFTKAQTVVVFSMGSTKALVYLGSRFWREYDCRDPKFLQCLEARNFSRY